MNSKRSARRSKDSQPWIENVVELHRTPWSHAEALHSRVFDAATQPQGLASVPRAALLENSQQAHPEVQQCPAGQLQLGAAHHCQLSHWASQLLTPPRGSTSSLESALWSPPSSSESVLRSLPLTVCSPRTCSLAGLSWMFVLISVAQAVQGACLGPEEERLVQLVGDVVPPLGCASRCSRH